MIARRWRGLVVALLLLFQLAGSAATNQFDRFGGYMGIQREASGFFRVEKVDGRWLFITPEGHGYVALGANHIGFFLENKTNALTQRCDGDQKQAEQLLRQSVQDLGFNAGEAYGTRQQQLQMPLPWIASLNYPGGEKFKFDVFDPAWQAKLRTVVIKQCRECATDPMVLGIGCIDLPHYGPLRLRYFRNLPPAAPGRQRYEAMKKAGHSDEDFLGVVADTLYAQLKLAVREGAPHHLFFGEKFQLRDAPDAVLKAVGNYVDVFCTQALVRSPQRPPEWETFQKEVYDHEFNVTGKPMLIIDWSAPFSLGAAFDSPAGRVKPEAEAAAARATWLADALAQPYLIGVFRCMLLGLHPNDKMFDGHGRRSCLRDDGTPFAVMTERVRLANNMVLQRVYGEK